KEVILWDAHTLEPSRRIASHRLGTFAIAFTPDGRSLVTGGYDTAPGDADQNREGGSAALVGVTTGRELRRFPIQGAHVIALAISRDGRQLAMGATDGSISMLDLSMGNMIRKLMPDQGVKCLKFSPDGKILASGGTEGGRRGASPAPVPSPAKGNDAVPR